MKEKTNATEGSWRLLALVACNVLALVLLLSRFTAVGRAFWEGVDARVFPGAGGHAEGSGGWGSFPETAASPGYGVAVGVGILAVWVIFMAWGSRPLAVGRVASGLLIGISVVLAVLFAWLVLGVGRSTPPDSPPWWGLLACGAALMTATAMVWFLAGGRYGLAVLGLSLLWFVPGLAAGTHRLGDHLAGAAPVSLVVVSWILCTPAHRRAIRLLEPPAGWVCGLLAFLAGGGAAAAKGMGEVPVVALKGFCMGSADVIPGVSGGTMALILGIYERLLAAIRSFDGAWFRDVLKFRIASALARNDLMFLIPLAAGIFAAILFFTRVVSLPALIISHPEIIYGLFFGLIVASIVVLMEEVTQYGFREVLVTLAGVAFGLAIVNLVPVETPTSLWFIFLCGFVAICAMLLPGISGSFILLILGKYAYIINALGEFNLAVIVTFSLGAGCGMMVFSRAIMWLLRHYHQATLLSIKGILIGSLWMIWPFQERVYETVRGKQKLLGTSPRWPESFDATVWASLALMLAGFALVMVIHRLSRRNPPVRRDAGLA